MEIIDFLSDDPKNIVGRDNYESTIYQVFIVLYITAGDPSVLMYISSVNIIYIYPAYLFEADLGMLSLPL